MYSLIGHVSGGVFLCVYIFSVLRWPSFAAPSILLTLIHFPIQAVDVFSLAFPEYTLAWPLPVGEGHSAV